MHDIEPYYQWRDLYISSEDEKSPYFGTVNNEFSYSNKIYNYFIHPQWDSFDSTTLYLKVLFVDYDEGFSIIEFIGEWNDSIENDIMYLKREVVDRMVPEGIYKFILICENVYNFHGLDNDYYEEWYEDVKDGDGWICFVNILQHVEEEMNNCQLKYYIHFGKKFNDLHWRKMNPTILYEAISKKINK
ncbi:MAG: hypothetical protein HOP11_02165 [Saprospiraceae bacterium]|nr:hypothetical protein [Saprospiraceae bacterium]